MAVPCTSVPDLILEHGLQASQSGCGLLRPDPRSSPSIVEIAKPMVNLATGRRRCALALGSPRALRKVLDREGREPIDLPPWPQASGAATAHGLVRQASAWSPRVFDKEHGVRRPGGDGSHEPDGVREIALVAFSLHGRRADATEIDALWQGLLEGGWQLVDRFDCHSDRYLILREQSCSVRSRLSRMEGLVLRLAARGAANKEIAIDLQVSLSSAATYLRRALLKRRFFTRLRLRETYAFLLDADGSSGASSSDEAGTAADPDRQASPRASRFSTLRITEVSNSRGRLTVIARNVTDRPAELTPAEHEVATRAASGMSNRDIALLRQRSMRTIANQMASAFQKLGVTSRSGLAAALVSRRRDVRR